MSDSLLGGQGDHPEFAVRPDGALRAVATMLFVFSRELSDSEDARLRDILHRALESGSRNKMCAREIRESFPDGLHYPGDDGVTGRVRRRETWDDLVARTELSRAMEIADYEMLALVGRPVIQWLTSADEKTCERCSALDGKLARLGEPFEGTDVKHPLLHPGCRCVIVLEG